MGRPKTSIEVACLRCGTTFQVQPHRLAQGFGRYCSRECYQASRPGQRRRPYRGYEPEDRSCEACSKPFLVGGRGRPRRDQRFCSRACQQTGRYRHGSVSKEVSVSAAAWIAGFLDGEGSVMLHERHRLEGRTLSVALRVTASNTHRPTLEHIVVTTGVGAVIWNEKRVTERHKPSGWWLVNGEAAESVLRQTLPYMVTKREQAELAIAFQARLRDPALKADRAWQRAWLERMRKLNRRGPA